MDNSIGGKDNFDEDGFPAVGDAEEGTSDSKAKKPIKYALAPNDSLTLGGGFINEIRSYIPPGKTDDDALYFARIGLIQGSEKDANDQWVGVISNYDVLMGRGLRKLAKSLAGNADALKGVRFNFKIRNLTTSAEIYENKPVQRSRGVLEAAEIGGID